MTNSSEIPDHKKISKNLGYVVGDKIHSWRAARAKARGTEPLIVPSVGYGTTSWVRVIGRALYKTDLFEELIGSGAETGAESIRGWRSFTSIAISHAAVTVTIGEQSFNVVADEGGVIDTRIEVSLEPGVHDVTMEMSGSEIAITSVYIVPPEQKYGVIVDVDDTVMITALPRPFLAAWNSFVLNEHARIPTPGMAVLMDRIKNSHPQAPFMYLSTGAWNITPALRRFLTRNGYPKGTFLLTDWGPTRDRWFRSGAQHKVNSLKRLVEEFPDINWILIGDDGQRDPDIYNGFAVRYPDNVAAILIRNLTVGETVLSSHKVWVDHKAQEISKGRLWAEGHDGMTLYKKLRELELVD